MFSRHNDYVLTGQSQWSHPNIRTSSFCETTIK
jgi:hypothetical protein